MTTTTAKITALKKATVAMPEYALVLPLFTAIYGYVQGREADTGITAELDKIDPATRTANGFPLISPLDLVVDTDQARQFLVGLIEVMKGAGNEGQAELDGIVVSLEEGKLDITAILRSILERSRQPIEAASASTGIPASLIEYIFEIPLKTALEQLSAALSEDYFAEWGESLCPFCGSRAGMAELYGEGGQKRLCCSTCQRLWNYKRLKCPYCGCEDVDKLSYFTAGEGTTRVDTCKGCSRYIKTRDQRSSGNDVPLEAEDLLTIHLDLLATKEGFERGK
ncbi:MAG: formate dehydrogenase accessory protein FdhE [Geobacteraceae bacterium]|nr:formate dehydrogenase accessory protein FdhE [Geobacteraceae bacterium]